MKIAMAMSHGKLIFVLFVVFNVTLVRSVFNQTNETDVGEVNILNTMQPYNATETTPEEEKLKEMHNATVATNGTFWTGLRKESGHSEQLFHNATTKAAGIPVTEEKAVIIIPLLGCVLCSIILIFHYDIPKKIVTYVRQFNKHSVTDVIEEKFGIFLGKPPTEEWMKLQLQ
ncbi:hypothetical protein T11_3056 [Trichinella zimbabwensis]|nr:hypothetical protein T11_3056 [Trichinella zimbabwensis]